MRQGTMTYVKVAVGLGFMAALVSEVLWLLRLDTEANRDWPVVVALIFFISIFGLAGGMHYAYALDRVEKSGDAKPWVTWLLLIALVASLIWRSLPELSPALACSAPGSRGWVVRQLCANAASRAHR